MRGIILCKIINSIKKFGDNLHIIE